MNYNKTLEFHNKRNGEVITIGKNGQEKTYTNERVRTYKEYLNTVYWLELRARILKKRGLLGGYFKNPQN